MAGWKLRNKAFSDPLEAVAKEAGLPNYFEQVNFIGPIIPTPVLNEIMTHVK